MEGAGSSVALMVLSVKAGGATSAITVSFPTGAAGITESTAAVAPDAATFSALPLLIAAEDTGMGAAAGKAGGSETPSCDATGVAGISVTTGTVVATPSLAAEVPGCLWSGVVSMAAVMAGDACSTPARL